MTKKFRDAFWTLLAGAIAAAACAGYVFNIVKLAQEPTQAGGMIAVRVIGVLFPPLGAVLGLV